MPQADEIDFDAVPDLCKFLFLMSTGNGGGHFMIQRSGTILSGAGGGEICGRSIMEVFPAPLNERALETCLNAVRARQPMIDSGILVLENDSEVIYRMIMMPLSKDDNAVDHVLGAFSFRRSE